MTEKSTILNFDRDNCNDIIFELPQNQQSIPDDCTVDYLLGANYENARIFTTRSHREIYGILLGTAKNLVSGNYKDTMGVCSSTLVGAKGIGKTISLQLFTQLAKYYVPNLHVVYISYNNILNEESPLKSKSLANLIAEKFHQNGFSLEKDNDLPTSHRIVKMLKEKQFYLLILVDELDQLYKVNGNMFPNARSTLSELAYFGNQPSGKLSVILCGSSTLMENLITTNVTAQIKDVFPMLTSGAINLNCTKFKTKRVYSTLPIDINAISSIANIEMNDANKACLRLLAYASGCSARSVQGILCDENDYQTIGTTPLSGDNTHGNDDIKYLRHKIMKAFVKKNKKLFTIIFGKGYSTIGSVIDNIGNVNWEEQFQPLKYKEIESLWAKMIVKGKVEKHNKSNLAYYILHMIDRCWLTFDGIQHSQPHNIYPFSMINVGNYIIGESEQLNFNTILKETIKQNTNKTMKLFANPQIIGRVLSVAIISSGMTCMT